MTYKIEMTKYLRDHKLPADEGTYPEELMAQITIKAFCERRLNDANNKLMEIKEIASDDK